MTWRPAGFCVACKKNVYSPTLKSSKFPTHYFYSIKYFFLSPCSSSNFCTILLSLQLNHVAPSQNLSHKINEKKLIILYLRLTIEQNCGNRQKRFSINLISLKKKSSYHSSAQLSIIQQCRGDLTGYGILWNIKIPPHKNNGYLISP